MLGMGARYAEYGITGGFFIVAHVLLLGFAIPGSLAHGFDALAGFLNASYVKIPVAAQPAVQSIMVAIALLSVFIFGLMLEMVGSILMVWEAKVFRKHLIRKQGWIARYIESQLPDYLSDYREFLKLSGRLEFSRRQLRDMGRSFLVWKKSGREVWKKSFRDTANQHRLQQLFRRVEFALIAKVIVASAKTEMLTEQIGICRMSRAIAAALYLMSLETFLAAYSRSLEPSTWMFLWWLGGFALMLCATLITTASYSRYTLVLFSLVYAGWKRPAPARRNTA